MVTKIVHVGTHTPERLYKAFKRDVGVNGTTVKDVINELMARYVEETKNSNIADKFKTA